MTVEELVPLTNGLSVVAGTQTLVCDRARITPVNDSVDMSFWIAGTDLVPRLRLKKDRLARATADELTRIVRSVARVVFTGERHAVVR
jgi:hypothetical protein